MLLTELNDDVLRHIFEKCSISEVIRLYYVCRRFQAIVSRYTFLKKSLDLLLVGHRNPDTPCFKRFDLITLASSCSQFSHRHLLSGHCMTFRITNASNYSKIGATAATRSMLCFIKSNSIHRVYIWRRSCCTSHTVDSCAFTNG